MGTVHEPKSSATLVRLHEGQIAFLSSSARTTVVTAGVGGGKTYGAYFWLVGHMEATPGESWLVGFPDYPLLERVILHQPDPGRKTLLQFLESVGVRPTLHIGERRIATTLGQIFFASGEHLVGWQGAHVQGAWLDEFDDMPVEAYHMAMERTRLKQGLVLLTGTPRHIRWVKTELRTLYDSGSQDVNWVEFPSTANPLFSDTAMEEAQRLLPAWEFQRMYMGKLAEREGGGVFRREWWNYYTEQPTPRLLIFSADTAFKDKTSNDYSVIAVWCMGDAGNFYLLDLWRGKVEFPELERTIKAMAAKWTPSRILIEDAASGQSLIQTLHRNTSLPIIPIKVDRDKYSRASAVTGLVEARRVYLPSSTPWLHDFIEEHASFPQGAYDDMVDTTSMALAYLKTGSGKIGLYF